MTSDRPRTIRAVFSDPVTGKRAVNTLREAGFPVDVSGALSGDVVARIQADPHRLEELGQIVEGHDGRIEDRAT